jgi:YcxB-like protein
MPVLTLLCRYCLFMGFQEADTTFSLCYELQPDDVEEALAADGRRKRRRARALIDLSVCAVLALALTLLTVALDRPGLVNDTTGAPSWLYLADIVGWALVIRYAALAWRLAPKRQARRVWRTRKTLHGQYRDEVGADGVTGMQPNGSMTFIPWPAVAGFRESERTFCLLGADGAVCVLLPKRSLPDPALGPALAELLARKIGAPQAAAATQAITE